MEGIVDFLGFLQNLEASFPALWTFVTALTYFLGICFAVHSLFLLKKYGESRTMMSQEHDLKKPLLALIIAASLLYWPSLLTALNVTIFEQEEFVTSYDMGVDDEYQEMIDLIGHIIQFVGFIGFVRGIILLAKIGEKGQQQSPLGKAITHIIAGFLAINVFTVAAVLSSLVVV